MNTEHNEYELYGYTCLVYYKEYPPYMAKIERKLLTSTGNYMYEIIPPNQNSTIRISEEYIHCINPPIKKGK